MYNNFSLLPDTKWSTSGEKVTLKPSFCGHLAIVFRSNSSHPVFLWICLKNLIDYNVSLLQEAKYSQLGEIAINLIQPLLSR